MYSYNTYHSHACSITVCFIDSESRFLHFESIFFVLACAFFLLTRLRVPHVVSPFSSFLVLVFCIFITARIQEEYGR